MEEHKGGMKGARGGNGRDTRGGMKGAREGNGKKKEAE